MSWNTTGNIKGPPGTAVIPDPLLIATRSIWGNDLRITSEVGGGKVEARNPTTNTWFVVTEWTALPVP